MAGPQVAVIFQPEMAGLVFSILVHVDDTDPPTEAVSPAPLNTFPPRSGFACGQWPVLGEPKQILHIETPLRSGRVGTRWKSRRLPAARRRMHLHGARSGQSWLQCYADRRGQHLAEAGRSGREEQPIQSCLRDAGLPLASAAVIAAHNLPPRWNCSRR